MPNPKPEVRVGVAGDVEAERVVEHRLVAVGRRVEQHEPVAGGDRPGRRCSVVGRGGAEHVVERRDPADHLLDRAGHERRVGGHRLPLVGVLGRRSRRPRAITVRVVSAPPEMNRPVSCIIDSASRVPPSIVALAHDRDEVVVVHGQPLRSPRSSRAARVELHDRRPSRPWPIAVVGRCASVRISRSDHDLMSLPAVLGPAEQLGGEAARELRGDGVDHLDLAAGRRLRRGARRSVERSHASCWRTALGVKRRRHQGAARRGADRPGRSCWSRPARRTTGSPGRSTNTSLRRSTSCTSAWRVTTHRPLVVAVDGLVGPHPGEGRVLVAVVEGGSEQVDVGALVGGRFGHGDSHGPSVGSAPLRRTSPSADRGAARGSSPFAAPRTGSRGVAVDRRVAPSGRVPPHQSRAHVPLLPRDGDNGRRGRHDRSDGARFETGCSGS